MISPIEYDNYRAFAKNHLSLWEGGGFGDLSDQTLPKVELFKDPPCQFSLR